MVPLSEPGSAAVFRWAEQTHSFDSHFAGEFYIKADGLVFFCLFDKKCRRLANAAPCQPLCQARRMRHLTFLPVWPERRFPRVNHILPLSCPEPSTASGHVAVRPPPRPIRLAGRGPPSSCSHHTPSPRSPPPSELPAAPGTAPPHGLCTGSSPGSAQLTHSLF